VTCENTPPTSAEIRLANPPSWWCGFDSRHPLSQKRPGQPWYSAVDDGLQRLGDRRSCPRSHAGSASCSRFGHNTAMSKGSWVSRRISSRRSCVPWLYV